ncbi:MAG: glycosyltransferase family 9 protein [Bacteroidota bacterium]
MKRGDGKLHFIDRYVGIPLVALLGFFRIRRKKPAGIHTIALFEGNAIGDTVLLLGVIKDVREKYPTSVITFFVGPTNYEIAKLSKYADKIIRLPLANPAKSISLIRQEGKFDVFVDLMTWPRISAIYTGFAKAKLKVGFKTPGQHRHYVYDLTQTHSDQVHEIENFRRLLSLISVPAVNVPTIEIPREPTDKRSIVLHMFPSGAKAYLKKWPESSWETVARYFLGKGYTVSITGGPADKPEGEEFAKKFASFPDFKNYAGTLSLKDTIAMVSKAQLVISVNTGILHIAAALHVNLIGLNGPTSIVRWGPLNTNSVALKSPHPDSPCLNLGFEYKCGNENCNCMALITVEEVLKNADKFL